MELMPVFEAERTSVEKRRELKLQNKASGDGVNANRCATE